MPLPEVKYRGSESSFEPRMLLDHVAVSCSVFFDLEAGYRQQGELKEIQQLHLDSWRRQILTMLSEYNSALGHAPAVLVRQMRMLGDAARGQFHTLLTENGYEPYETYTYAWIRDRFGSEGLLPALRAGLTREWALAELMNEVVGDADIAI